MELLEKNPETGKITRYHSFVGEIMFSDIFEQVNNVKDLNFVILNLCASIETAANDWYSDNVEPYVDPFFVNYEYLED